MQAIILVGGLGTRLRKVVSDIPKPMADINGKPFLEFLINKLVNNGITDIILAIGYKGDVIQKYFKDGTEFGCEIKYSFEKEPLGTGGAIINASHLISCEDILIMNGDTFFDINLKEVINVHISSKSMYTMALRKQDDASRYGAVEFDTNLYIRKFVEKGSESKSNFINGGIYIVNRKVLDFFSKNKQISMETCIIPWVLEKFEIKCYLSEDYFIDIGVPDDYYKFIKVMKSVEENRL